MICSLLDKLLVSIFLCLSLFACTKNSEIVSFNAENEVVLVQNNLIEELANLTEEFASLPHVNREHYDLKEREGSNDQVNQVYAEQFVELITKLHNAGVSEDEISAAFISGSSRRLTTLYSVEKATPCHDAHVTRMRGLDAAAATCVTINGLYGNLPGVLTCLVAFEVGKLVSEDVLRDSIRRRG